jgi:hypothetical protein
LALFVSVFAFVGIAQGHPAKKPPQNAGKKVTICHRTGSETNPYAQLRASKKALKRGHARHPGDIIPAPTSGCPATPMSATQGGTMLSATLTGAAEVPGPGDPDGSGQATIRLTAGEGRLCFQLTATGLSLPASGAHIHIGAAGSAGIILVPLTPPDATGPASGCVTVQRAVIKTILANPSGHYVNIHNADFPDGAIRGQLTV